MRAYSAGILFYSVDPGGDTRFYLGRERMCPWKTALTWADFGGRAEREDDDKHEITAAREAHEESLGVFGTLDELTERLRTKQYTMKITTAKHNRYARFRVLYCLEVPHGVDYAAEFLRRRHLLLGVQVMTNTARARLFGIQVKGEPAPGTEPPDGGGVIDKIRDVSRGWVTFELEGGGLFKKQVENRELLNRYADVHTMQTLIMTSIDALPPSLCEAVFDWSDPYLPGVRDHFMEKDRLAEVTMQEVVTLLMAIRKTSSTDHPLRPSFTPLLRIFITQLTLAEDGSWRL